jgi:hypothetical protein
VISRDLVISRSRFGVVTAGTPVVVTVIDAEFFVGSDGSAGAHQDVRLASALNRDPFEVVPITRISSFIIETSDVETVIVCELELATALQTDWVDNVGPEQVGIGPEQVSIKVVNVAVEDDSAAEGIVIVDTTVRTFELAEKRRRRNVRGRKQPPTTSQDGHRAPLRNLPNFQTTSGSVACHIGECRMSYREGWEEQRVLGGVTESGGQPQYVALRLLLRLKSGMRATPLVRFRKRDRRLERDRQRLCFMRHLPDNKRENKPQSSCETYQRKMDKFD